MSIYDQKLLPKLENDFGNIYLAVKHVAEEARKLQSANVRLSEARAITWVLSGKIPEELSPDYPRTKRKSEVAKVIDDYLEGVTKSEIRSAVKETIVKSLGDHHLLYEYLNVLDEGDRARVRVLSNMIWCKLETIEEVY